MSEGSAGRGIDEAARAFRGISRDEGLVDETEEDEEAREFGTVGASPAVFKLPPVPTIPQALWRGGWASVSATIILGIGVVTTGCFVGFLVLWLGSRVLLHRSAQVAGAAAPSSSWIAGFYAVVLACLLALGAGFGAALITASWESAPVLVVGVLVTAVVGAALAPLAYVPIASACGARGWIEPITVAIDVAGRDRMRTLAPLCALIGVALLIPIPLVAAGVLGIVTHEPKFVAVGSLALVVWLVAVPASAAALTVRYLRLEEAEDAPTALRHALAPILGAFGIGATALVVSLVPAIASPLLGQPAYAVPLPPGEGEIVNLGYPDQRLAWTDTTAFGSSGLLFVTEPTGRRSIRVGVDAECHAFPREGGGAVARCVSAERGEVRVVVARDGTVRSAAVPVRLAARVGPVALSAIGVALLTLALALLWLGRVGRALRLLARPPFSLDGAVHARAHPDEDALFRAAENDVHLRVSARQIEAPPDHSAGDVEPAVLLSPVPIGGATYRTTAALPAGAMLILGSREAALAARIARTRTIAFRVGLVGLLSLLTASGAILAALR